MMRPVLGTPGVSDERSFGHKHVFRDGKYDALPGGGYINCTKSRDPFTGGPTSVLSPGTLIGQVGTTQRWATSFFGKLAAGIVAGATSLTVSAAEATEIVRRKAGSTGSLLIVGPPVAGAPAQVGQLTFSAVNTSTGVVTVSATGANEVQTAAFTGTPSGGTFRVGLILPDWSISWTGTSAHNATFATVISNLNTALDAAFGTSKIVASGSAYTAVAFTFSGAGFANREHPLLVIDVGALTGATGVTVVETTKGNIGTYIAGSLIADTDGTHVPKSLIPPGYGIMVADEFSSPTVEQLPVIPYGGIIDWAQVNPTVTDASIRLWIEQQMSALPGGKFTFSDYYNSTL